MSKALYRKYRPQSLAEVIGQEQVTATLQKSLDSGKISHAYLFIGPRGCGKTSVARIFAHAVNKFDYQLEDDYTDIIEIDAASNTGVDNIRELREKATIAPTKGKYKVYIIDEVHMLSKSAFNALLKTLEEPPAHVIFIMATTDAYKVPVTITSRAQVYTFKLADTNTMCQHLRKLCDKEGIKITDGALNVIARRGGGSFRDSISLLDQISTLSDQEITEQVVISALGLPSDELTDELLAAYQSQDVVKITTLLKDSLSSGTKPETLAEELIAKIFAKPSLNLLPLLSSLPTVSAPFPEAKLLVALLGNSAIATFAGGTTVSPRDHSRPTGSEPSEARPVTTGESERVSRDMVRAATKLSAKSGSLEKNPIEAQFNWDVYLDKIKSLNDAVYSQLKNTTHELGGNTIHLYPQKKIAFTILSRDHNRAVLMKPYPNFTIKLHEFDTTSAKNPAFNQISAIMGGAEEVNTNGEGVPF